MKNARILVALAFSLPLYYAVGFENWEIICVIALQLLAGMNFDLKDLF